MQFLRAKRSADHTVAKKQARQHNKDKHET